MKSFLKDKKTIFELLRYLIVGAVAALVDGGVYAIFANIIFSGAELLPWQTTISVAAGFITGLITNYLLSMLFVFTNSEQKKENKKKFKTFIIFALVGLIGFVLSDILMILGLLFISKESILHAVLFVGVKGIVMLWNYLGRKIFVYKGN